MSKSLRGISLGVIILTVVYIIVRVIMSVMSSRYGYVFYKDGVNLKGLFHNLDLVVAFISLIAVTMYFKNKVIMFVLMVLIVLTIPLHFLMRMGIEDLNTLDSDRLDGNYLVELLQMPVSRDDISLSIKVYKEKYPMMYKKVGREIEEYSKSTDSETIDLYKDNAYEVSEDGSYIQYGKFKVKLNQDKNK